MRRVAFRRAECGYAGWWTGMKKRSKAGNQANSFVPLACHCMASSFPYPSGTAKLSLYNRNLLMVLMGRGGFGMGPVNSIAPNSNLEEAGEKNMTKEEPL